MFWRPSWLEGEAVTMPRYEIPQEPEQNMAFNTQDHPTHHKSVAPRLDMPVRYRVLWVNGGVGGGTSGIYTKPVIFKRGGG